MWASRDPEASNVRAQRAASGVTRLLLALLLGMAVAGAAVWASPTAAALLDASSRAPRTSLLDTSAVASDLRPQWSNTAAGGGQAGDRRDPASERAGEHSAGDPARQHWAVVIGVDAYQGPTIDTIGSVADARLLTDLLDRKHWRDDHVRTLTNAEATEANIREAFAWLARKTDEHSTAVVSFSGHIDRRRTADGLVSGLWTHDNERIWRHEFAEDMAAIDAGRMWISLQGCYAAGLASPAVEQDGRVVTYSSRASQASYEDPEVGHSVMGNYLFREGLAQGWGNGGDPEGVSVQGAFDWAAPRAETRTGGRQSPVLADRLGEPFTLEVHDGAR